MLLTMYESDIGIVPFRESMTLYQRYFVIVSELSTITDNQDCLKSLTDKCLLSFLALDAYCCCEWYKAAWKLGRGKKKS